MNGMPTVWIGLDAVEGQEVQRRMADGRMPHLAALARRGRLRAVDPDVPGFCGGIWRSFVNGVPVGEHGWHFSKIWRPELGRLDQAGPDWLRLRPFWDRLRAAGLRVGLVDVPHAPDPGPGFDGVYVSGWQTHDYHPRSTRPASLTTALEAGFGRPWLRAESYGPQSPGDLLRLHQQGLASIQQIAAISEWLLGRHSLDFFMVVVGGAHRLGHYLWDLSQIDEERLAADDAARLSQAMDDVYAACDAAVGRIASAAPAGARVVAFALHGMGANPGWTDLFPEMVRRLGEPAGTWRRRGLRDHLLQLRRSSWALRAHPYIPEAVHRLIGRQWSSRMHAWGSTRVFSVPGELGGNLRVNLAGREAEGIVEPDVEYDDLCRELCERLGRVRSLGGDEQPIVGSAHIVDRLVPADAAFRTYLPDIVLEWGESRIGDSRGIALPGAGEIRWQPGRRIPSGRSGNHRPRGWVLGDHGLGGFGAGQPNVLDLLPGLFGSVGLAPDRRPGRLATQAMEQNALARAS